MSTDEVLAANLWPWPDPLLKRDQAGRILFVNAAFLQLYGGRVEDWSGQIITGWPAPVAQGAQRFETRAGQAPAESIFDWVEMVMADGNAMAIARNVTAFIAQPTPPQDERPVVEQSVQMQTQPSQSLDAPVIAAQQAAPAPQSAPSLDSEDIVSAPSLQQEGQAPDMAKELEDTLNNDAADYAYEAAAPTLEQTEQVQPAQSVQQPPALLEPAPVVMPDPIVPEPAAPQTIVPVSSAPQPTMLEPAAQERGGPERRILPIADSRSVLGNNWRDQVIAKAVGADIAPDSAAEDTQEASQAEQENSGAGLSILLAEDNAINALLTRTLLEAEGAEVDVVEDGALAVEAVRNKSYDLIFMDMRMPNMDGLESTRKIRSLGGAAKTMPIIALTANAFDDDRNACFDSGMNDFMTKPVSAEELAEMVVNWTKKEEETKLAS